MNINIYYGGRGLVDDPTILVINKIQEVLDELNVNVNRYNLYEMKNTITTLSQTVTEADGIILATTVEWVGMGGYMQTFLDSCWLYSDKSQDDTQKMVRKVIDAMIAEFEDGASAVRLHKYARNGRECAEKMRRHPSP